MTFIVLIAVVVIVLFWGVVVSIMHRHFTQALIEMLPLIVLVCLYTSASAAVNRTNARDTPYVTV